MANQALVDYAAKQNAYHDRQDAAVTGVTADVEAQAALIKQLQDSPPGNWTPEDQAILDQLDARNVAVTAKLEALDALTPPPAPPVA